MCVCVYDYVSYPSSAAEKSIAMLAAWLPNGQRLSNTQELCLSYTKLFSCKVTYFLFRLPREVYFLLICIKW